MTTHIYAFGSVCRGDIEYGSDIDLLVLLDCIDTRFDSNKFSIYSYNRIYQLWEDGNPFAWHLHLESSMIYSSDGIDYLKSLGVPSRYKQCRNDCLKFHILMQEAIASLKCSDTSKTFDLSTIFLGMRNIASCFSLGYLNEPIFTRNSAIQIGQHSINIDDNVYRTLENARILCTRGIGANIDDYNVSIVMDSLSSIEAWASRIVKILEEI